MSHFWMAAAKSKGGGPSKKKTWAWLAGGHRAVMDRDDLPLKKKGVRAVERGEDEKKSHKKGSKRPLICTKRA